MKKYISVILCFLFVIKIYGQEEWFSESSIWTYNISAWGNPGMLVSQAISEDTIINGIEYRKIKNTEYRYSSIDSTQIITYNLYNSDFSFYRQEGNKIYHYSKWLKEDTKMFDFDKVTGDTLDFTNYRLLEEEDFSIIDSIGEIEIDNQVLKFQDIRIHYEHNGSERVSVIRVIEKLGPINSINSAFAPPFLVSFTDPAFYDFNCFKDETIEYVIGMNYFGLNCEELPITLNTVGLERNEFKIYPNPFSDIINIENPGNEIEILKILTQEGKELRTYKVNSEIKLNLENVNSNYLILIGLDAEERIKMIRSVIRNSG